MWIANTKDWDNSHTPLSKYFIEKLKQTVDFEECISNQHKSTNGFTLIKEIIDVSTLAIKREKSINRLISLLNEAKSETLAFSILNDHILGKYYPDIVKYYKELNTNKLKDNPKNVMDILTKSQINFKRIGNRYFNDVIDELKLVDFKSKQFIRNSLLIDKIINCAIPYLLHCGYSVTSLSDISYRYIFKKPGYSAPMSILNKFRNQLSPFEFIIQTTENGIELKSISTYLEEKGVKYKVIDDFLTIEEHFMSNIDKVGSKYIQIKRQTSDPHNYLRNLYEVSLKKYVISKGRQDLSPLNDFFDRVLWR